MQGCLTGANLFSNVYRKNISIVYGDEQEKGFDELKSYLSTPPTLADPVKDELLLLYLAVSEVVVSVVLFKEKQGK